MSEIQNVLASYLFGTKFSGPDLYPSGLQRERGKQSRVAQSLRDRKGFFLFGMAGWVTESKGRDKLTGLPGDGGSINIVDREWGWKERGESGRAPLTRGFCKYPQLPPTNSTFLPLPSYP